MQTKLKSFVVITALAFASCTAYAETVTISTYYPSPYGSYQTLETNTLQGAGGTGNIKISPNAGNVGIRNGAGAPGSLLDIGNSTLGSAATINVNAASTQQTGLNFQSGGANSWALYRPGGTTDLRFRDSAADVVTMAAGGNVGIGVAPGAFKLNVEGTTKLNGALTLVTNTSTAADQLQVSCGATGCYAVYA